MDSLDAICFVDDFLNFSSDIEDQNPEQEKQNQAQNYQKHTPISSRTSTQQTHLSSLDRDQDSSPVLEEEEEELEWLNENQFPPLEPFFVVPVQSPKHQSPVSVLESAGGGSGFRVPGRARSRRQRRRRVGAPSLFGVWGGGGDVKNSAAEAEPRRRCRHCLAEKTPQWRAGPHGPKTLCNACGVRYKAGRLVPEYRPASSPTFSSDVHSNSHRKILEMRRKKQKALENG